MNTSSVEETIPLIPNHGTSAVERNTQRLSKQQLAMNFILASVVLQLVAYLLLDYNLAYSSSFDKGLNWTDNHSFIAEHIFEGNIYLFIGQTT